MARGDISDAEIALGSALNGLDAAIELDNIYEDFSQAAQDSSQARLKVLRQVIHDSRDLVRGVRQRMADARKSTLVI